MNKTPSFKIVLQIINDAATLQIVIQLQNFKTKLCIVVLTGILVFDLICICLLSISCIHLIILDMRANASLVHITIQTSIK
jgi:hypothetical protein